MIDIKETEADDKNKKQTWNSLAFDIAGRLKAAEKAKDIAIIGLLIINMFLATLNYLNNRDWRALFSSYDFVSQDGQGQNYYNSDVGGNVNNGSEGKKAEE